MRGKRMRKDYVFHSVIVAMALFSLLLMVAPSTSSTPPMESPNVTIYYPKINVSFIENNLIDLKNISDVIFTNNYNTGGWCRLSFFDNTSSIRISLSAHQEHGNEVIFWSSKPYVSTPPYHYNFSNTTASFLINACEQNITDVLNYICENSFAEDWNDFYPFDPLQSTPSNYWSDGPRKIDDIWYFAAYSYHAQSIFVFAPALIFALFAFISIIIGIFFGIQYKRTKKKYYLIFICATIIFTIIFLWLTYYCQYFYSA